ncbi:MAG: hypothetical protein ACKVT1_18930 [Dehalococcoidia bacterium]
MALLRVGEWEQAYCRDVGSATVRGPSTGKENPGIITGAKPGED